MSELYEQDIVKYTFHWHSQPDACAECAAVPKTIRDQDLFSPMLINPANGQPIWDLEADRSLMHGGTGKHCRCQLEVIAEVDISQASWWQELQTATRKL